MTKAINGNKLKPIFEKLKTKAMKIHKSIWKNKNEIVLFPVIYLFLIEKTGESNYLTFQFTWFCWSVYISF